MKTNENDFKPTEKSYYSKNKKEFLEYIKKYQQKKKEQKRINQRRYNYNKRRTNPDYLYKVNLLNSLRRNIISFVKKGKIGKRQDNLINYEEIINYLKPIPIDIENYHIHHITPLCKFCFYDKNGLRIEEIKKAFKPKNHELLPIKEHKQKHDTVLRTKRLINIQKRTNLIKELGIKLKDTTNHYKKSGEFYG